MLIFSHRTSIFTDRRRRNDLSGNINATIGREPRGDDKRNRNRPNIPNDRPNSHQGRTLTYTSLDRRQRFYLTFDRFQRVTHQQTPGTVSHQLRTERFETCVSFRRHLKCTKYILR